MRLYLHHPSDGFVMIWEDGTGNARVHQAIDVFADSYARVTGKAVAKESWQPTLANGYTLKPGKRLQNFVNERDSILFVISGPDVPSDTNTTSTKAPQEPITKVTVSSKYIPPLADSSPTTIPPRNALDETTIKTLLEKAETEANKNGNVMGSLALCTGILSKVPDHVATIYSALQLCVWGRMGAYDMYGPHTVPPDPTKSLPIVVDGDDSRGVCAWRVERGLALAQDACKTVQALQSDAVFLMLWGDLYREQGSMQRAREQYQHALQAVSNEGGNEKARMLLKAMLQLKVAGAIFQLPHNQDGHAHAQLLLDTVHAEWGRTVHEHIPLYAQLQYTTAAHMMHDSNANLDSLVDRLLEAYAHNCNFARDVVCMLADVFARHPGLARQQVIRYTRQGTEGPARMWLLGNMLMRVGMMTDAVLVLRRVARLCSMNVAGPMQLLNATLASQDIAATIAGAEEWLLQTQDHAIVPWNSARVLQELGAFKRVAADVLVGYYETEVAKDWQPVELIGEHHTGQPAIPMPAWVMFFVLIRGLFAAGALPIVHRLLEAGASVPAHVQGQTQFQNQVAYFACICKIMTKASPPARSAKQLPRLYMLGDSHVLPAAWRHVKVAGEMHLVVPLLVAGCKIFHLRAEGVFYTKQHVQRLVDSLPANSKLVVMLGELDCRYGLLQSTRQAKYASLYDAVQYLADVYVQALLAMVHSKALHVYVHPIPPVHDECRLLVRHLNAAVQMRLVGVQPANGTITWMDCEDAMLEPRPQALADARVALEKVLHGAADPAQVLLGGAKFRQELSFDGAHMHPEAYMRLVLQKTFC